MLEIKNKYEIIVEKQDHFGQGITKIDGILVFIEKALPGDECIIEITNVKKNFATAKIDKLIEPSIDRVNPNCLYYDNCGGCHIMHQNNNQQLLFKEQKIRELIRLIDQNIEVYPIIGHNQYNYRNKVIFHGDGNKLGFYIEKTNQIVDIDKCIITNAKINDIYNIVNENLNDSNIKEVMIRITSLDEAMISFKGKVSDKLISDLKDVNTIYINDNLVKGNSYILEDIYSIKFKIYPNSFFQVNYDMMLVLYNLVIDFYKNKNYNKVLDLYCGTGTIGMLISKYVNKAIGVEKESSSIESANLCKEINNITNIEFIEGKVEDKIDLFSDINSIIVDPPRSGLDSNVIKTINKLLPESIVYVSCDPATLARDLKILADKYNIVEVHPVDMFPNTYHVETVCILERK